MAHDVFISHSSKDKTVADAVCAVLEDNGIRCWVAPRDIRPGADWGESIIEALRSSRCMVLIFSGHANQSPQIKREVNRAVDRGIPILPFRIENVMPTGAMEYSISTAHWLDAFMLPLENYLGTLVRVVREMLELPTSVEETRRPTAQSNVGLAPRPRNSRAPLVAGILFVLAALSVLGWYFGIEKPVEEGKLRQAQVAQQEAMQKEKELEVQQAADAAEKAKLEAQAKAAADEAARLKAEADAKATADETARLKAEADAKAAADETARLKAEADAKATADATAAKSKADAVAPAGESPPGQQANPAPVPQLPPNAPAQAQTAAAPPTGAGTDAGSKTRLPDDMRETAVEAAALFKKQQYEDAARKYDVIIDKYPDSLYAWSNLGVVRFQQGKFDDALRALQQAVKLSPTDAFSYSNLGIVYYQLGRMDDAIDALNSAKTLSPNDPKTHNYLGCAYSRKGRVIAAEREFRAAIEIDPNYGDAHFNLAFSYATSRPPSLDAARKEYARALELGIAENPGLEKLLSP